VPPRTRLPDRGYEVFGSTSHNESTWSGPRWGPGEKGGRGGRSRAVGRARLPTFPSWRARRRYLKRSSKACRPDLGAAACVSRSTVVRGFQSVQSLRASFTAILAAIGCRHCRRAPGSKNAHCVHAWSSALHLPHRALLTSALDSSPAQREQRMTSRHFIRFGARGPSGWSARGRGRGARGVRGVFRSSSWYPRCRYLRSDIAPSRPCSRAPLQPAPARGLLFTVSKAHRTQSLLLWRRPGSAVFCVRSPAREGWGRGSGTPVVRLAPPGTTYRAGRRSFSVLISRHVCRPDNQREAARSAARTLPRCPKHGETLPRSISLRGIVHLGIPNQQVSGVALARADKFRFLPWRSGNLVPRSAASPWLRPRLAGSGMRRRKTTAQPSTFCRTARCVEVRDLLKDGTYI